MNKIDNGGPAFPKPDDRDPLTGQGIRQGSDGMSLRDWFAGKAMAAIIIGNAITVALDEELDRSPMDAEARDAYRYADYMLKARQP